MATMTGALAAIWAQVTSGVPPPRRRGWERLRSCECVHWATPTSAWASMASDGPAVLVGQPVDAEVEIDPGRGDRAVSGLGLDGFDGHARLAQSGEAGVAQLVAGAVGQTGPHPGGADDLVEAGHRERLAATRSFERDEERVARRLWRSLVVHVARHRGEEGGRQRHQAFVSALAFSDQHPPFAETQIAQAKTEHLAAPQAAEHHGLGHGPVPLGAQRSHRARRSRRGRGSGAAGARRAPAADHDRPVSGSDAWRCHGAPGWPSPPRRRG